MLIFAQSLLTAAISVISSAVTTYGPMIARYGSMILKTVGDNLPTVLKNVELMANLTGVSGCQAQELGAKAAQSEKKPEDFDSFNDYIHHLEHDVTLDETEKNDTDTLCHQAAGAAILLTAMGDGLNSKISLPLLNGATQVGIAPAVIIELIKAYDRSGLNGDDFAGYLDSSLPLADTAKHSQALMAAFQKANPAMTLEQAEDAVMALR